MRPSAAPFLDRPNHELRGTNLNVHPRRPSRQQHGHRLDRRAWRGFFGDGHVLGPKMPYHELRTAGLPYCAHGPRGRPWWLGKTWWPTCGRTLYAGLGRG